MNVDVDVILGIDAVPFEPGGGTPASDAGIPGNNGHLFSVMPLNPNLPDFTVHLKFGKGTGNHPTT
jgi:hypothetical protein